MDVEFIKREEGTLEFNVTRCRLAEWFREFGEPELGFILLYESDFQVAEVGSPLGESSGTRTIIEGARVRFSLSDERRRREKGVSR